MCNKRIPRYAFLTAVVGMCTAVESSAISAPTTPIVDPKQWCGDEAQLVGDKDFDKMLDAAVAASGGLIDEENAAQLFAQLAPLLKREGALRLNEFLLQQDYGKSFTRIWYLVFFDTGPIFIRCDMINLGTSWIVQGLSFQSTADGIRLP